MFWKYFEEWLEKGNLRDIGLSSLVHMILSWRWMEINAQMSHNPAPGFFAANQSLDVFKAMLLAKAE